MHAIMIIINKAIIMFFNCYSINITMFMLSYQFLLSLCWYVVIIHDLFPFYLQVCNVYLVIQSVQLRSHYFGRSATTHTLAHKHIYMCTLTLTHTIHTYIVFITSPIKLTVTSLMDSHLFPTGTKDWQWPLAIHSYCYAFNWIQKLHIGKR